MGNSETLGRDLTETIAASLPNGISKQESRVHNSSKAHMNLKVDYFHIINTKEKAYWLGLLYADGCLTRTQRAVQIRLEISRDDESTIDRFCECLGLEKTKKERRIHRNIERETVEIRFACKEMNIDLMNKGLKFRKSRIIEFPRFIDRILELAFLIGYNAGDGQQNNTRISSGSIRFLRQIKKRFDLPYKIHTTVGKRAIYGRMVNGKVYYMSLGPELFNEMMRNYQDSLPRKRWFPCDAKERARRAAKASTSEMKQIRRELQSNWKAITEDELDKLIREMTPRQIAINYDVSNSTNVTRKCKKFGISIP
jgi:hypothetical protein